MSEISSDDIESPRYARPNYLPFLLAALFMVIGITTLVFLGREESRLRGQPIGDIDLHPLLYAERPIEEHDLKDKVVVLHLWGFWCGPCVGEYPGFAALQKEYESEPDVLFISVACDGQSPDVREELISNTELFLKSSDIPPMPIYWDPAEYTRQQLSHLFKQGGFAYPTTLVLDRSGKVADVWRGTVEASTLKKSIESARRKKK